MIGYLLSCNVGIQVSTTGVTGARADVSFKVEALLQEIKQV
jgi:tryptophan synthase alpha subunit